MNSDGVNFSFSFYEIYFTHSSKVNGGLLTIRAAADILIAIGGGKLMFRGERMGAPLCFEVHLTSNI
jgi:hypothetical protein